MYKFNSPKKRIDWIFEQYSDPNLLTIEDFVEQVNVCYYKYSVDLYQDRYVEDIEEQYRGVFNKLNLADDHDLVIVDIGGGAGFEFEQISKNNISYKKYYYIEPDSAMVEKFSDRHEIGRERVNVCHGQFADFAKVIAEENNKLIIINSCFHHLIWVGEFLDLIKTSTEEGDLLLICHEPVNNYSKSPMIYLNYFLRFCFTDIVPRKLCIWHSARAKKNRNRWTQINEELIATKIFRRRVSPLMIRRIIDYGANNKGDWKLLKIPREYDEGFWTPEDIRGYLGDGFKLVYFDTYRHLGDSGSNRVIQWLNKFLANYFHEGGSAFCIALEKDSK